MKSGVATTVRAQAAGLAARGHEVMVLAPSNDGRSDVERDGAYTITRVRSLPIPFRQNLRLPITYEREIRRIISDFNPDIVHVHTQFTVGLATLRAAVNLGIPVVATNHVMPDNIIKNVRLLSPLSRPMSRIITEYGMLLYRGAKLIIMPTESALKLFNLETIESPTMAVSNGIDLTRFQPLPPEKYIFDKYSIPRGKPVVAYLGRLDAEKHLETLLQAANLVMRDNPAVTLLFVGTGNVATKLAREAEELGVRERTIFTGLVSDEDIVQLHRAASVYVMPSPNELQSISTLEAMASGKPIVAVKAGALGELCHDNENGFMCETDNIEEMAAAIKRILGDEKLRRDFGTASAAIAARHDLSRTISRYEQIYSDIIREYRNP